jgi:hypothetical protein
VAACDVIDFTFPMQVDILHPIVEQGSYGNIKKEWLLDRTIACNFSSAGSAFSEDVKPNINITQEFVLVGRLKADPRLSARQEKNSITNVILTNIKDKQKNYLYNETAGVRSGRSTIFELASVEPFVGPFGSIEYYKVVIRRSENQAGNI